MATSRISNTIKDPTGTAIASVPVQVRLMPSGGFRISDFTEVARLEQTTTDSSGVWQLDLERNSNITPANSWYEVTELVPDSAGGKRVWNIAVGASDQSLLASLVTPAEQQPTVVPAGTVYLDQASADARYQALGSLGSSTPVAVDAAAGTAGVSTSASRQDHDHQATVGTPVATGDANAAGSASSLSRSDHVHKGVVAADAWATWSPTLTNLTLGNGSVTAKFVQLGKTVHYYFLFTLGSTSAVGTNPQFTLPVAPVAAWTVPFGIGSAILRDNGTAEYFGAVQVNSGSTVRIISLGASSVATTITATSPFTWTNTDNIWVHGTYEAA